MPRPLIPSSLSRPKASPWRSPSAKLPPPPFWRPARDVRATSRVTSEPTPRDVEPTPPSSAPAGARGSRETAVGGAGPGLAGGRHNKHGGGGRRRERRGAVSAACPPLPASFLPFPLFPAPFPSLLLLPGPLCAVMEPGRGQRLGRAALPRRERGRVSGAALRLLPWCGAEGHGNQRNHRNYRVQKSRSY